MHYIGIDIGSTGAKAAVLDKNLKIVFHTSVPTGWSSKDAAERLRTQLEAAGISLEDSRCVATGYGRINVPFADKQITEITCHARGAAQIHGIKTGTIIDIGGQDTKIINLQSGAVQDFLMNDKCSAGTGRFLEVMANALGTDPEGLCAESIGGGGISISSMCTVFAETEIINLIGKGESRANIAYAVVESITDKVAVQAKKIKRADGPVYLTGGLSLCEPLRISLASKLEAEVIGSEYGRIAGAIGAAVSAAKLR